MNKAKKPTAAEVNNEVIAQWKAEHGKVMCYKTTDGKVAYFKEPDINTLDAASAMAATNPVKSNILIAKNCFIGGDEVIITDKEYVIGLGVHLKEFIAKVEGELSTL